MTITKQTVIIALVSIWIIFSVAYIARDLWGHFQIEQVNRAYQQGKTDTVNAAITQAKNEKCEPFSIYTDKEQIQLINVSCLKQAEPSAPAPSAKK